LPGSGHVLLRSFMRNVSFFLSPAS